MYKLETIRQNIADIDERLEELNRERFFIYTSSKDPKDSNDIAICKEIDSLEKRRKEWKKKERAITLKDYNVLDTIKECKKQQADAVKTFVLKLRDMEIDGKEPVILFHARVNPSHPLNGIVYIPRFSKYKGWFPCISKAFSEGINSVKHHKQLYDAYNHFTKHFVMVGSTGDQILFKDILKEKGII